MLMLFGREFSAASALMGGGGEVVGVQGQTNIEHVSMS